MSNNTLAFRTCGNWTNNDETSGNSSPTRDHHRFRLASVQWPLYHQQEEGNDMHVPWRMFEERVRSGPFALASFPSHPNAPARILIIDGGIGSERVNPRLRQFLHDSPPRIRREWRLGFAAQPEDPGLTDAEFKATMKKLRTQSYDPQRPKMQRWKKGLFSNRNNGGRLGGGSNQDTDGERQCTICLEAFVPREQVLVTPCNHMFHRDCLIPWVKSNGKCPVCRFELCERKGIARFANDSSSSSGNLYEDDGMALDLIALMRAMEEAFTWIHLI
ncbi:hypothetical protein HPP92_009589 [Vanilla planifolia]|uniref:RING-type E3 ubiquitin transferase n=1 Tax=Vanilla planifolia TaxID=51239 RepID=A0A835R4X9_VANPL|nr:hypothetical protein HPP92_009815 [Vanilla planifolia]KAG0487494.1 hypothetical protein HPP92_009589 [Vanilla planifolia]